MLAFFKDGKIKMHMIGKISLGQMVDACERTLITMQDQMRREIQDYAT